MFKWVLHVFKPYSIFHCLASLLQMITFVFYYKAPNYVSLSKRYKRKTRIQ
jgi:hypothetical protein